MGFFPKDLEHKAATIFTLFSYIVWKAGKIFYYFAVIYWIFFNTTYPMAAGGAREAEYMKLTSWSILL